MAPAEASQVVEHGFGQEASGFVFHDGHRAVALGELLAVGTVDERQVRKHRYFSAQSFVEVDLARRVVDVVGTADHMAHLHVPIVDHNGKVVSGNAVAHDDEVVELFVGDGDAAVDGVVPGHFTVVGIAEANDGLDAFGNGLAYAVLRAPTAVVTRLDTGSALGFTHGVELFGRGVALICQTLGEHFIDDFTVTFQAIHLIDRTFIVIEVEPLHRVENDLRGFCGGALLIGVFDTKQELAAEVTCNGPAVDGGTGGAQVHHARRGRCDASANFFHCSLRGKSLCAKAQSTQIRRNDIPMFFRCVCVRDTAF